MGTTTGIPELVAEARATAAQARVADVRNGQNGSDFDAKDFASAVVALETLAVDIFSVFEARMQHHFKRGPFSRKLRSLLLDAGQTDLADRLHQYYLAINVLKHGKGASNRELLSFSADQLIVAPVDETTAAEQGTGLVDVTVADFFDGLTTTILEAFEFLENR